MIRSAKRKFFYNDRAGDINIINIGEAVMDDKKLVAQHFKAPFPV